MIIFIFLKIIYYIFKYVDVIEYQMIFKLYKIIQQSD